MSFIKKKEIKTFFSSFTLVAYCGQKVKYLVEKRCLKAQQLILFVLDKQKKKQI
jgi:hypothetical protein